MNTSSAMLREVMIVAAIVAAVLSVAAAIARSKGVAGKTVAVLHYGGYALMFMSIVLYIIIGVAR